MKPVQIGITGGIGSGKSVVCKIFNCLNIPAFQADLVSKQLLDSDAAIAARIRDIFGDNAYSSEKRADRKLIASIVFKEPEKLGKLNAILHPAVRKQYEGFVSDHQFQPVVAMEAAIMFESGSYKNMDFIIAVTAPEALRIGRVMARDGKSREEVIRIMKQQLPQDVLIDKSNGIILNDEHHLVIPQVLALLKQVQTAFGVEINI